MVADLKIDLTLSLSKGEVAAPALLKSPILRQAQDEDFRANVAASMRGNQ